jgi:hypothetical protein
VNRVRRYLIVLFASACGLLACAGSASAELLYGANGAGNRPADLLILDPSTGGVLRTVGPIGYGVTGLAIDPTTGTLYGVTGRSNDPGTAPSPHSLITINRATGAGTVIGDDKGTGNVIADITFTPDGALFGWLEGEDSLATLSKATGASTLVGESGLNTYGSGIASNSSGVLYYAGEGEQGPLRTVDRNTGLTTVVGTLNGSSLEPGIAALAFNGAGQLFGATTPSDEGTLGSNLITIDPATAAITSSHPAIDRLDALVFVPSRSAVLKKKLKNGGEKVRLFGQINDSGDPACTAGQAVKIQRKTVGPAKAAKKKAKKFKTFRTLQSNQAGSFSTKTKVARTFKYRALLPESTVCDDATSKVKKVKA